MKRRKRNSLIASTLIVLAACLDVSFTVAKTVTLPIDATSTTYTGTALVDLSTSSDFQSTKAT